jgi:WD40 repeat protein
MSAGASMSSTPFVGLRPFDTADAAWFFGRDREATSLAGQLQRARFTAVVGPSGSGKSSIVRAGVVPRLQANDWRVIVTKPGSAPLQRLAQALASVSDDQHLAQARRFRFDAILRASAFGLAEIAELLDADAPQLLVVVDQFEEVFRLGNEARGAARAGMREEARAFVELLLEGSRHNGTRLHVCITMRSDYFGACSAFVGLAEAVSASQFLVPLPVRGQLEESIRTPVKKIGAVIEEALVQRLLVDVEEESDPLPLLQHTLRRLWERASGDPRTMKEDDYVKVGKIAGSINLKASAVLDVMGKRNITDLVTLERIMKALTDLDVRDRAARRRQNRSQLVDLVQDSCIADRDAAEASVDRVLASFRAEDTSFLDLGEGDDPEVDIGHEALIRSWDRLAGVERMFKTGWLRQERDDGEQWRTYVRRVTDGPVLSFLEQRRFSAWVKRRLLGEVWTRRYGDKWEQVNDFRRTSWWRSIAFMTAIVLSFAVVLAGLGYWGWNRYWTDHLHYARLNSLSLADRARVAAREGDARLAALLARAALPAIPRSDDPYYVAEAEGALVDALARPIETRRTLTAMKGKVKVAFSSDGTLVAEVSADGAVRIWDTTSGDLLWGTSGDKAAGDASVDEPTIESSWGDSVAAGYTAAFSPDGKRLLSASGKVLRLWDVATGKPVGESLRGHTGAVIDARFSPDGSRVVSTSTDNSLRLWDAASGKPVGGPLLGHLGHVVSAAFSPDGTRIVSTSIDKTLRIWDSATGQPIGDAMTGHGASVVSAVFSPDGTRIVSASEDMTLRLWDGTSGKSLGDPLRGHTGPVLYVTFSPDGRRILSASADGTLRMWDAIKAEPIGAPLQGHTGRVLYASFSPDGAQIVSAASDNTLRLWDVASGKPIGTPLRGHTGSVINVAFLKDGKHILSVSEDNTLRLWDGVANRLSSVLLRGHADGVLFAAFSPDSKQIVSASWDQTVRLWDAATGREIGQPLIGHTNIVITALFSPDGRQIVSASADKTLRLWDASSGKTIGEPFRGHKDGVMAAVFSPDGKRIVSASADQTLGLWDLATHQLIREFRGHAGPVYCVAFSPDGKRIISGSEDRTLLLWDVATGRQLGMPFRGHTGAIVGVAFSPDGKTVLSSSLDATLRLWDVSTHDEIGQPLRGHTDAVYRPGFSPDGRRIVSASADRTLRMWDAATGQPVGEPLVGHTNRVFSAAFAPDGMHIVSASEDKTLRLWEVGLDDIATVAKLCPLNDLERREHGLSDSRFREAPQEWTAEQRRACGQ